MAEDLSKELIEKILDLVKNDRKDCVRVEIGRRYLFKEHCGMRMIQVKVFYIKGSCSTHKNTINEYRGTDEAVCVCPNCLYHFNPSD